MVEMAKDRGTTLARVVRKVISEEVTELTATANITDGKV